MSPRHPTPHALPRAFVLPDARPRDAAPRGGPRRGAKRAVLVARPSVDAIVQRAARLAPHVARLLVRTAGDWELVPPRPDAR